LSSTLDRPPEAQKNCHGLVMPRLAPRSPRNESAGIIVTNTPTKTTATSWMGAQLKRLASWMRVAVVFIESAANALSAAICVAARAVAPGITRVP